MNKYSSVSLQFRYENAEFVYIYIYIYIYIYTYIYKILRVIKVRMVIAVVTKNTIWSKERIR